MKITTTAERGSILMLTLITAGVIGLTLAAYLEMVKQRNLAVHRSRVWNSAMAASEAGIEEAMSHLRAVGTGNRSANGWVTNLIGGGHRKTNDLGDIRYDVIIGLGNEPMVTSTGYAKFHLTGKEVSRVVQVATKGKGQFGRGLVAKGTIAFGGQFESDSYDSGDVLYSTGGMYDKAKRKDNGDIGSMAPVANAIDMASKSKVYGKAAVSATGGVYTTSDAAIGTAAWINAGKVGIEPGRSSSDLNVSFPPAPFPTTGGFGLPGGGLVGLTNYARIFAPDTYTTSTVSMSGDEKWLITGDVTLIVDKDFSQSGGSQIYIAPGASLKLYVKEGSISISGSGVANAGGKPESFSIIGRSHVYDSNGTLTQKGLEYINLSGNGTLISTIYAPDAEMKMSGGGTDIIDFSGAAIVGKVTGSGSFRFHYDEALGRKRGDGDLTVASWREI
ncbi:MAG: hypothetical protein AB1705_00310 [Verrucomicrobiota bacterium]